MDKIGYGYPPKALVLPKGKAVILQGVPKAGEILISF